MGIFSDRSVCLRILASGKKPKRQRLTGIITPVICAIAFTFSFTTLETGAAVAAETEEDTRKSHASAIFAGGCFWCIEADFEKLDSVFSAVSGYSGGFLENPTYKDVTGGNTGHLEVVKIYYDPKKITYRKLVDYFLRQIDPLDDGGQFCDRGPSYKSAIFAETSDERLAAQNAVKEAETTLGRGIVTPVRDRVKFWRAETYHQDYYKKNALKYKLYRTGCGRDRRLKKLWGSDTSS